jgi:hypothetical protein
VAEACLTLKVYEVISATADQHPTMSRRKDSTRLRGYVLMDVNVDSCVTEPLEGYSKT